MLQEESVSVEIPGVGEVKARPGTSTLELAGAVKYWSDRYKKEVEAPRREGFIAGLVVSGLVTLLSFAVYHLWS